MSTLPAAAVFDLDGTLARSDHVISARTIAALSRLPGKGILPIIVTGRTLRSAQAVLAAAGVDGYIGACNGAVAFRTTDNAMIKHTELDPDRLAQIVEVSGGLGLQPVLYTLEGFVADRRTDLVAELEGCEGYPATIAPLDSVDPRTVVRVTIAGTTRQLADAAPKLSALFPSFQLGMAHFAEVPEDDADKSSALAAILADAGIDPADCIGFADAENDVSWLSLIGYPIAMGNAFPAVKAVAAAIIGVNDDDAVADYLEKLVET